MSCHAAEHHLKDIILPMQIHFKENPHFPLLLIIKKIGNAQPGPKRPAGLGAAQRAATPVLLHVTLAEVMMEMEGHRRLLKPLVEEEQSTNYGTLEETTFPCRSTGFLNKWV